MWVEKSPNTRASRVAIAGSIYMRRASLQVAKQKQMNNQNIEGMTRAPSYGKIVKNGPKKASYKLADEISVYSRKVSSPLKERNQFISQLGLSYQRKTPTPSFGHFDNYQNSKIKAIEQKYRTMLSDYQTKKKSINNELTLLKSSTSCGFNSKPKQYQNKIGTISSKTAIRGNQNILKEYEAKSKQLIIEKISGPKTINLKKKQKASNLYPNFFKAIKNQILLEEQLRIIKYSVNPDRKSEVQKILLENQYTKCLKLLDLDPEQFDPFENRKCSQLSSTAQATKLVQKYKECENNWKEAVCNISKKQAREIYECLNFEKAQEISIKSFVREMSFLLEKHLRNRDLLRIYNRLAPLTHHNFCLVVSNRE